MGDLLKSVIDQVLENSSSFCMDNKEERDALADALSVELKGVFNIKKKTRVRTVLSRVE